MVDLLLYCLYIYLHDLVVRSDYTESIGIAKSVAKKRKGV